MHIIILDESDNIRSASVAEGIDCVIVGSDPQCHVYLPDICIAEQHLQFRRDEGEAWHMEKFPIPKGSSAEYTRVFVNALEAEESHQLKQNDEIFISRFRLRVFLDDVTTEAPRAVVLDDAAKIRAHPLPAGAIVRPTLPVELRLRAGDGTLLTSFTFRMHECLDLNSLMTRSTAEVLKRFGARQVWIGMRRRGYGRLEFVESLYADGRKSGEPPRLESYQYRCIERGQFICTVQTEEAETESAMCVPLVSQRGLLGMLYVDNKGDAPPYDECDLDLLSLMGLAVARQLEQVVEEDIKLQQAITVGEQSFVRELQARMDPTNVPQWPGLQLAMYCKPGQNRAGDTFDVMRLPNGLAAFFCGNISGTATRAAIAMAEVRAAFRMAGLHADPPHVLLRALNWMLFDEKNPCGLCGTGVVMNPKTGAMQVATAGDAGAVIMGDRGAIRDMRQAEVPDVGRVRDFAYTSESGRLMEGETMVLYSPGCTRAMNSAGRELGEAGLLEAVGDGFNQPASATLDELLSDLKAYFRDGNCPDDMTVMVIHRD